MLYRKKKTKRREELVQELRETDTALAGLNRELATQMILLAKQTGETQPLIDAVNALRTAQSLYDNDSQPFESAQVQQALADTLLMLGRKANDRNALESARDAYRGAITLASVLGDDVLREDLRTNYRLTLSLLGHRPQRASLFKVA